MNVILNCHDLEILFKSEIFVLLLREIILTMTDFM